LATSDSSVIRNHAAFIWSVADLLRGDYKQSEYGRVILPLTVIRRLDCVLEPTKNEVLAKHVQSLLLDRLGPAATANVSWELIRRHRWTLLVGPHVRTALPITRYSLPVVGQV
jgi:type I restriction enzyme M protein